MITLCFIRDDTIWRSPARTEEAKKHKHKAEPTKASLQRPNRIAPHIPLTALGDAAGGHGDRGGVTNPPFALGIGLGIFSSSHSHQSALPGLRRCFTGCDFLCFELSEKGVASAVVLTPLVRHGLSLAPRHGFGEGNPIYLSLSRQWPTSHPQATYKLVAEDKVGGGIREKRKEKREKKKKRKKGREGERKKGKRKKKKTKKGREKKKRKKNENTSIPVTP